VIEYVDILEDAIVVDVHLLVISLTVAYWDGASIVGLIIDYRGTGKVV
jgi:hypothetical protein